MGVDHLLGLKPHIHWDWHIEMLAAMDQNYLNGPFLGSDQALGSFVSFCQQHKGNKKHIIFFCFHPNVMAIPKIPQGFCFNTSDHGHPWPSMTCQDPTQFTLRGPAGRSSWEVKVCKKEFGEKSLESLWSRWVLEIDVYRWLEPVWSNWPSGCLKVMKSCNA